jgi:hypothetical protein
MRHVPWQFHKSETVQPPPGLAPSDLRGAGSQGCECRLYVLRSKSEADIVASQRDTLHMLLVADGTSDGEQQIANARLDPVFLRAEVEVIASHVFRDAAREEIEAHMNRVFDSVRVTIATRDDLGRAVRARKWFLAPLEAIEMAVARIRDGTIPDYVYDPRASLLRYDEAGLRSARNIPRSP